MPKYRTLLILALLAAVSVALAAWSWQRTHARLEISGVGEPLISGLAERGKEAARIEIIADEGGDDERLVLVRKGGKWFAGPDEYPADVARIRKFLVSLVELRKAEPKTTLEKNYPLLDVDTPGKKGKRGTRVKIMDSKGAVIADVILGKPAYDRLGAGKKGQYARLAGDRRAWLVEGLAQAVPALTRWVNKRAVDLPRDEIVRGKIVHADGEVLEVRASGRKGPDGEELFEIVDKPQGAKEKANYIIATVAKDMAQLDFELARKARPHEEKPLVYAEVETKDGLVVGHDVYKEGDALWVAVRVVRPGKSDKGKKLAERIARTVKGWEYGLSNARGSYFLKRLKDIIEAEEKNAEDLPASPPSGE